MQIQLDDTEFAMKVLRESGWSPDRTVGISLLVAELHRHGFDVFDAARTFLESFAGLVIRSERMIEDTAPLAIEKWKGPRGEVMTVAPERVCRYARARWSRFEEAAGCKLCPIGLDDAGLGIFFIGDQYQIFEGIEGGLQRYGNNLEQSLVNLCDIEKTPVAEWHIGRR